MLCLYCTYNEYLNFIVGYCHNTAQPVEEVTYLLFGIVFEVSASQPYTWPMICCRNDSKSWAILSDVNKLGGSNGESWNFLQHTCPWEGSRAVSTALLIRKLDLWDHSVVSRWIALRKSYWERNDRSRFCASPTSSFDVLQSTWFYYEPSCSLCTPNPVKAAPRQHQTTIPRHRDAVTVLELLNGRRLELNYYGRIKCDTG